LLYFTRDESLRKEIKIIMEEDYTRLRSSSLTARKETSRNVYMMLALCASWGLADSIWTGTLIVAWIFLLSDGSNSAVGYIEAVSGVAAMVAAFPVGYIADKYGRSPMIKVAGILFLVATFTTAYAVYYKPAYDFYWLGGSMCLWGIAGTIFNGPAQALFADSLQQGDRSLWYSRLFSAWLLPSIIGPITAIVLFQIYGNNWTFDELRPIILVGLVLEIPVAVLSFFFRDVVELEQEETAEKVSTGTIDDDDADHKTLMSQNGLANKGWCGCTAKAVPYIMFLSSILCALGSGMTVKFFPLFFKGEINMDPASVQGIYVVVPLTMIIFVQLCQRAGKTFGRVQVMLIVRLFGVSLLMLMSFFVNSDMKQWYFCVPVYVVRTAIMNATGPLEESIVMDFVPSSSRARWKSLDSISTFGWCGSAALGGYLADRYSYAFTFQITASLQGASGLILLLLLPLVPRRESGISDEHVVVDGQASVNSGSGLFVREDVEEPFLSI